MRDKRQKIWDEITNYRDRELVQIALAEFESWVEDPAKERHREDLFDAEAQVVAHVVLTERGRAQLWNFLLTKRLQDEGVQARRRRP